MAERTSGSHKAGIRMPRRLQKGSDSSGGAAANMTPTSIAESLRRHDQYVSSPELNDKLYLQGKGFGRIAHLEPFTAVTCLWLESNCIRRIEGLDQCARLQTLYLHENCIEAIDNLGGNLQLQTLNLRRNCLTRVDNLAHLPQLANLNLAGNRLSSAEDIAHLAGCQALVALDLQANDIADAGILDTLAALPLLRVLYLKGNPVISKIPHYRRTVINRYTRRGRMCVCVCVCLCGWGGGSSSFPRHFAIGCFRRVL